MKKLKSLLLDIRSKSLNYRVWLLCKIFVIWLLLQFFLQTFITFKLGRNGKFRTFVWIWKEIILLVFIAILIIYILTNLKHWISAIKNKENADKISLSLLIKNFKPKFIIQFILLFTITFLAFFIIALLIQNVWLWTFILSFKYDLIWFFIFWIWICLALLFFSEKDKDILDLYHEIIKRCVRWWLFWWFIVRLMPNVLKIFWYNPFSFEWTVWQSPPVAYYTLIDKWNVRNQFLFERPTSFWFRLVAFFPVFILWYLRNKSWKKKILPTLLFWLLIFSTRSRAWIAVRVIELVALFFILYRKFTKKYLIQLSFLFFIWLCWVAYLWRWIMVREHSNTGHLVLMKEWLKLANQNLLFWRWAGYSGPASHQLCFTDEPVNIYEDINSIHLDDSRCEIIRKINIQNKISTYGFNPENQYIQILMEYGIVWILFRLGLCWIILLYTTKMIRIYRNKNKSPYQEFIYYCLLWFWIWFLWLCAEWMILHSLADRMIIYPFFLLYWITIWLWEKEKDKQYIPVKIKKSKKIR